MKTKIFLAFSLLFLGIEYTCYYLPEKKIEKNYLIILNNFEPLVDRSVALRNGILNAEHNALCDSLESKELLDSLSIVYQMCENHLLLYNDTSINRAATLVLTLVKQDNAYLGFQRYLRVTYDSINPWVIDGVMYYP